MFDSVIFDLDGTLWDSSKQIYEYWKKVLDIDQEKIQKLLGKTSEEMADCLGMTLTSFNILQQGENLYLRNYPAKSYEGVKQVLETLRNQGKRLFIVSNCQSGYADIFLITNDLEKYFEKVLCFGDTKQTKQANIKSLIDKYGISPIVVGDTEDDMKAAINNNLRFIWASYGFGSVVIGSENTINHIGELITKLEVNNNVQN